jgi:hypothetical protein
VPLTYFFLLLANPDLHESLYPTVHIEFASSTFRASLTSNRVIDVLFCFRPCLAYHELNFNIEEITSALVPLFDDSEFSEIIQLR